MSSSSSKKKNKKNKKSNLETKLQGIYSDYLQDVIPVSYHESLPNAKTVATTIADEKTITAFVVGLVLFLNFLWPKICGRCCGRCCGGNDDDYDDGESSGWFSGKKKKRKSKHEENTISTDYGALPLFEKGDFVNVFFGEDIGRDAEAIELEILRKKARKVEKKEKKEKKKKREEKDGDDGDKMEDDTGKDEDSVGGVAEGSEVASPPTEPKITIAPREQRPPSINDKLTGQTFLILQPSMPNPDIQHPPTSAAYAEEVKELEASSGSNFLTCKIMQTRSPGGLGSLDTSLNSKSPSSLSQLVLRTPLGRFILIEDQVQSYILDKQFDFMKTFTPTASWKEIPPGAVVESRSSVEYKINLETGGKMARITW